MPTGSIHDMLRNSMNFLSSCRNCIPSIVTVFSQQQSEMEKVRQEHQVLLLPLYQYNF